MAGGQGAGAEFAGRLTEAVRFEARADGRGTAGESLERWTEVARCRAWIEPIGDGTGSAPAADGRVAARRLRAIVRRRAGLAIGLRMRWRGRAFTVLGLDADPAAGDRLTLIVEPEPA